MSVPTNDAIREADDGCLVARAGSPCWERPAHARVVPATPGCLRSLLVLLVLVGLTGCGSGTSPAMPPTTSPARSSSAQTFRTHPAAVAPITNTDPCASRMHDIGGWLLLYFSRHNDLPADLVELAAVVDQKDMSAFSCPVSGLPYVYNPSGISLQERNAWIVLHDAAPSHANRRWAITIAEPALGQPLVTKVIALPESFFLLHPPQ